jgi:3-oxo-5alpha-steroid 4-dehydrogenase
MARARGQVGGAPHPYQRYFGLLNGYVTCRSAPTLGALAERLGIDPVRLAATVAAYNAGVLAGDDALGKAARHLAPITTGPYFGIPLDSDSLLFPTPCLTLGGLRTEVGSGRVVRADGTAIPGLYAAGRTAVGVSSNRYVSGLSVADGIFSGRCAGRHAAGA